MKYTIQNISRRPLTIICNSGKALHMPPEYSCEVSETEHNTNPMLKKLADKRLIRQVKGKAETKSAASTASKAKSTAKTTKK